MVDARTPPRRVRAQVVRLPAAAGMDVGDSDRARAEAWIWELRRSRGFGEKTVIGLLDAIDGQASELPGRHRNQVIRRAYMQGELRYPHGNPARGETVAAWICRVMGAVTCPACGGRGWVDVPSTSPSGRVAG